VIVERSMDPDLFSNAYLVADRAGGSAVFVDSGAPIEPLLSAVDRLDVKVTHLLTTHGHSDHVAHDNEVVARFGVPVLAYPELGHGEMVRSGDLEIEALHTPGHSPDMLAFVFDREACFSGDTLFAGAVGGTQDAFDNLRRSVMDTLMGLPGGIAVYPGHSEETTIGREWDDNPFIRVWRGLEPEGEDACRVRGAEATLVLWARDYDGGGKAWVRFPDGRDAIVGGSQVQRTA
jgi:hydroxyacylglutathione hydrolase